MAFRSPGAVRAASSLQSRSPIVKTLTCAALCLAAVLAPSATAPVAAQDVVSPAPFRISTLETVRARGYVICAATGLLPGFAQISPEGLWSGFDIDLCRAIAAAVFGDPSKVEFRPLSGQSRFAHLAMGDVDVIARNASWTMSRDTEFGASYVGVSFYDGQAVMVPSRLGIVSIYELEDVTICVASGSEAELRLGDFFFSNQLSYSTLLYEDREDLALAYRSGQCDAITASAGWLQAVRRTLPQPAGHSILPERLSKEAYGPVVRSNDEQWKTIIRWTLYTLINAEEFGVTAANIDSMLAARTASVRRLLSVEAESSTRLGLRETWMRDVIASVGNYGEIYSRHFGNNSETALMRGQNALWVNGGLMFAPPFE